MISRWLALVLIASGIMMVPALEAETWEAHAVPVSAQNTYIRSIWGSSPNNVYAVGNGGLILHYNGREWVEESNVVDKTLKDVWGYSSDDVYIVGHDGTILHYDGNVNSDWEIIQNDSQENLTQENLMAVCGDVGNNVFAVGSNGTVVKHDKITDTWSVTTLSGSPYLFGCWGSNSSSDVYATGFEGSIFKFNGSSWESMTSGTSEYLYGVWGSSKDNVYSVGKDGGVYHYDGNIDDEWQPIDSGYDDILYGIWGSSADDIYAVGLGGTVLYYDGYDHIWDTSRNSDSTSYLKGVWGTSASNVFAVGASGTILHYPPVVPGDIDHSQTVDLADAIAALQITAGISSTEVYLDADVNGDGRIGTAEAIFAIQTAAN